MPESISRVMEAVSKINQVKPESFVSMDPGEAKAWAKTIAVDEGVLKEKTYFDKKKQETVAVLPATVNDVLNRMTEVSKGVSEKAEKRAQSALEKWQLCEEHADEVGADTPEQALVISERVVKSHIEMKQQQQELASQLIDSMQSEGFDGPTSKLIDLTVDAYIKDMPEDVRGDLTVQTLAVRTLKEDPRFND